jgi:SAM-dependent methyltransferase
MPPSSPFEQGSIRQPHPLAERLCAHLRALPGARVLDVGTGSGRNSIALRAAGLDVTPVSDAQARMAALPRGTFDAAIATHALLHGRPEEISALLRAVATALAPGARLYATFGSVRDARYDAGDRLGNRTFSPTSGDETGVAHTYFNERELRAALAPYFEIVSLEETNVDGVAGRWAHAEPLRGAVHWLAEVKRGSNQR